MNFKKLSQGFLAIALSLSIGVPAWGAYLSVHDGSITTAKLATGAVTQSKLAARATGTTAGAGDVAVSTACTAYTVTASKADVTNLSVSITTTGRPVYVGLISDGNAYVGTSSQLSGLLIGAATTFIALSFDRGGSNLGDHMFAGNQNDGFPLSGFGGLDFPSAGVYTYKLRAIAISGASSVIQHVKLVAYEL